MSEKTPTPKETIQEFYRQATVISLEVNNLARRIEGELGFIREGIFPYELVQSLQDKVNSLACYISLANGAVVVYRDLVASDKEHS